MELKVKYSIGKDTKPVTWSSQSLDFDIKSELSGDITIEMASNDRYHTNLEIALSKNSVEVKSNFVGAIIIIDTIRRGSLNPAYAKVRPSCPLFIIITPGTMGPHYYELERQYNSQM